MTSHWSSLAVIETFYGLLTRELKSGVTVIDPKNRHVTQHFDVIVSVLCILHTWYSVCIHMYTSTSLCDLQMCLQCLVCLVCSRHDGFAHVLTFSHRDVSMC